MISWDLRAEVLEEVRLDLANYHHLSFECNIDIFTAVLKMLMVSVTKIAHVHMLSWIAGNQGVIRKSFATNKSLTDCTYVYYVSTSATCHIIMAHFQNVSRIKRHAKRY